MQEQRIFLVRVLGTSGSGLEKKNDLLPSFIFILPTGQEDHPFAGTT